MPPLKCATCLISTGCSWNCLRGKDLAQIAELRDALKDILDLCLSLGDFKNGVTHNGIDEGEVYAGRIFDKASAALR